MLGEVYIQYASCSSSLHISLNLTQQTNEEINCLRNILIRLYAYKYNHHPYFNG